MSVLRLAVAITLVAATRGLAQQKDSAFHEMQRRGAMVMGVDQYTSVHHFDKFPDGGRIALQRDVDDSAGTAVIRKHLRDMQHAFSAGDFSAPTTVHMHMMPGTAVMAERRNVIRYDVRDIPRGAELRMRTTDSAAVKAIHEFMDAQRTEHHVSDKK